MRRGSRRYKGHVDAVNAAGADQTYLTMHEAGVGLGEHLWEALAAKR